MKRVLLACVSVVALAAITGSANAADLSRPYGGPVVKAPVYNPMYNWTGFYLGINGGGGWGHSAWDSNGGANASGGLVGGTVGYNWQNGQVVFGLEGDIDWTNIKGTTTNVLCPFGCTTANSWLGTARGRVGYTFDRFLPYLTGGAAFGDIKASGPTLVGATQTNLGWTIGGGVEFAAYNNWTLKAEYLYVDLGKFDCGLACGAAAINNVAFHTNIARAGLNYRF